MDAILVYAAAYAAWLRIAGDGCCHPDGTPKRFGLIEGQHHSLLPPWLAAAIVAYVWLQRDRIRGALA